MLKELKLFGFKSFANKTKLIFPRPSGKCFGITAIVGPNGSGKSNLVETIQWILGEQKYKNLRSHTSQDLIFSGSHLRKPADFAEAALTLENKTNSDIWSEIQIKRRIWRNGESEYLLNNNKVRLSDIETALFKINFGKYNYSIINQGEISRLLDLTPRGRKEFFDEATGVKPYLKEIDTSQKKIERSKENLARVEIALKEISPQLSYLSKQVRKLAKRQKLKQELFKLEKDYYQAQYQKINQEISSFLKKNPELEKKARILKEKISNNDQKIQKFSSSKMSNQWQSLHQQYQEKEAEKSQCSKTLFSIEAKIQSLRSKAEFIPEKFVVKATNEQLFEELKSIKKETQNLEEEIKKNDLNRFNLENKIKKLISSINKVLSFFEKREQEESKESEEEIKKLIKSKIDLEKKIKIISDEARNISAKLGKLAQEEDKFRQSFADLEQENHNLRQSLEKIENALNENKINLAHLDAKKNALCEEIEEELGKDNLEKITKINSDVNEIKSLEDKKGEIQKIKRELLLIGEIDPEVEREYPKILERHNFLKKESDDLKKSIDSLTKIINRLQEQVQGQFQENFKKINKNFNEYFRYLFGGGSAKLNLITLKNEDEDNGSSKNRYSNQVQGIEIEAIPPGKKVKSLKTLSGGEKTLTSLALLSAVLSLNKPPFVIYDEVDAALDEENSLRFAQILKELNTKTQLIVVTHNRQTMQAANTLYGVTMTKDGVSKILSVQLER